MGAVELWETPDSPETYLIAGWRQWADAGSISSNLPEYLIEQTGARKIGQIDPTGFYLFQLPGTHHFLRPEIRLEDGYRRAFSSQKNEIFYTELNGKGLVIFLGDEPHLHAEDYAGAFFDMITQLNVRRAIAVGGVYGPMPYEKDREISCIYSLLSMKNELAEYAVKFSNYEGGATIGSFLVDRAEAHQIQLLVFYAFVPVYDFSQLSASLSGIRIENDYKAWYDILRRVNHMFGLGLDLSDLLQQSDELTQTISDKIDEIDRRMPEINLREHLTKITNSFTERSFMPLDDVWERELGDIFDDIDDD